MVHLGIALHSLHYRERKSFASGSSHLIAAFLLLYFIAGAAFASLVIEKVPVTSWLLKRGLGSDAHNYHRLHQPQGGTVSGVAMKLFRVAGVSSIIHRILAVFIISTATTGEGQQARLVS